MPERQRTIELAHLADRLALRSSESGGVRLMTAELDLSRLETSTRARFELATQQPGSMRADPVQHGS